MPRSSRCAGRTGSALLRPTSRCLPGRRRRGERSSPRPFAAACTRRSRPGSLRSPPSATGLLAIEDVHWADASSLELTLELGRLCDERPLVLLLTARPEAEADARRARARSPGDSAGAARRVGDRRARAGTPSRERSRRARALDRRAHDWEPVLRRGARPGTARTRDPHPRRRSAGSCSPGGKRASSRRRWKVYSRLASICCPDRLPTCCSRRP